MLIIVTDLDPTESQRKMTTACRDLCKSNLEQAGLLCVHSSPPADFELTEIRGHNLPFCPSTPTNDLVYYPQSSQINPFKR